MAFRDLWIWKYMKDDLPWYYEVANNQKPAKFLIADRVPADFSENDEVQALWARFGRAEISFIRLWSDVRYQEEDITKLERPQKSLLDLLSVIARRTLERCTFCEWKCGVNRIKPKLLGACALDATTRVASFFHHHGEELVFRGVMGSGTVFFTSCNMRCAFCQNSDISRDRLNGAAFSPSDLAFAMVKLRLEGAHNINLVGGEPTPHMHTIVEALRIVARKGLSVRPDSWEAILGASADPIYYPMSPSWAMYKGLINIPVLWNSNFYMTEEFTRFLRVIVDVWLPDFKFGNDKCAIRLSRTPFYVRTVTRNLKLIYGWGEDMIIRHLIMPNHVKCDTRPVLDWIAKNTPSVWVNIMDQYRPEAFADPSSPQFDPKYSDIARRPSPEEIREAYEYAKKLGIKFDIVSLERLYR
ncbi:MAG: radical SAM protein [Acidilobus sp.]